MKSSRNHHKDKRRPAIEPSRSRQKIFLWVVLGCVALAVGYTSWGILRARASAGLVQAQGAPPSIAQPSDLEAIQNRPHLVYLHEEEPPYGQVTLMELDSVIPKSMPTELFCDRIYYAAGNGICLRYDPSVSDSLAPPRIWVTLFGSD